MMLYQQPAVSQKQAVQILFGIGALSKKDLKRIYQHLGNPERYPKTPKIDRQITLLLFMQVQPPTPSLH